MTVNYDHGRMFINGKEFNSLLGIVGLSLSEDEILEPTYGYDGGLEEGSSKLETEDKIALADAMIARWQLYKEQAQNENEPTTKG